MSYQPKEGSGSLFRNDKKGVENRPDYRGDLLLNGVLYEVAAWVKEGKKGKFMSLSAKPKEERESKGQGYGSPAVQAAMNNDEDIPF